MEYENIVKNAKKVSDNPLSSSIELGFQIVELLALVETYGKQTDIQQKDAVIATLKNENLEQLENFVEKLNEIFSRSSHILSVSSYVQRIMDNYQMEIDSMTEDNQKLDEQLLTDGFSVKSLQKSLDNTREAWEEQRDEISSLRKALSNVNEYNKGHHYTWQPFAENHLETLSMPVLIEADWIRQLITEGRKPLQKQIEKLEDIIHQTTLAGFRESTEKIVKETDSIRELRELFRLQVQEGYERKYSNDQYDDILNALKFYADPKHWEKKRDGHMGFETFDPSVIDEDKGKIALDAIQKSPLIQVVKCSLCNDDGGWEEGSGALAEPIPCPKCGTQENKIKINKAILLLSEWLETKRKYLLILIERRDSEGSWAKVEEKSAFYTPKYNETRNQVEILESEISECEQALTLLQKENEKV
jgi:hypothetical protein